MAMDAVSIVLLLSVSLQVIAAVLALRLVGLTGRALGWVVLSAAFLLMAGRRAVSLLQHSGAVPSLDASPVYAESLALLISILAVTGLVLIAKVFKRLRDAEARNARQLAELQEFQRLTVGRELRAGELVEENTRLRRRVSELTRRAGHDTGELPRVSASHGHARR
jgi:hypothetical protein